MTKQILTVYKDKTSHVYTKPGDAHHFYMDLVIFGVVNTWRMPREVFIGMAKSLDKQKQGLG